MQVGKAIKQARVSKGWTQAALANKAGVSANFISLLEREKRDPSIGLLERIAEALEVPLSLLLLMSEGGNDVHDSPLRSMISQELLRLITSLGSHDDTKKKL